MIRFLTIRDLAVIERLEIELEPGLNVLTGETGTGKSIVVGALSLLRGARAAADLVRTGAGKAVVEAAVELPDGTEQVLRREVSAQGRSRAFIDGQLVTTATLRRLGASLLDLHGQHEHQALLDPASHLDLLDRYAGLGDLRAEVRDAFLAWRQASDALAAARRVAADRAERADLVAFELREIDEVDPAADEDAALAARRQILANADRLHRLAAEAYDTLYDGDEAVLGRLDQVWKRIEALAELDPAFAAPLEGRDGVRSQLEETAFALRPYASGVETSPDELQAVEARLARLERLKRRYGPTLADVLDRRARLRGETRALEGGAGAEAALADRVAGARVAYQAVAGTLSDRRRSQATTLAGLLARDLAELAMPHARFDVVFADAPAPEERWSERGVDQAEFFFSANPGEDLRPLARIASGGELSRMMLALRTLISDGSAGRTLVFDEVDAGIGGETAERVGAKLRALAGEHQVLCVTHLPQIAVYGTTHHRVSKQVAAGRTTTTVEALDPAGRTQEIARMMTGTKVSGSVLETARELLQTNSE